MRAEPKVGKWRRLVTGSLLMLALAGCVPAPDDPETRKLAFYLIAGGRLFTVDEWGSRKPFEFTSLPGRENKLYLAGLLSPDQTALFMIGEDFAVTRIDLNLKIETPLLDLQIPGGSEEYINARLGWAGQKIYLLARSKYEGLIILEADILERSQTILAHHLDGFPPSFSRATDFDLAPGGNQAYIAYENGKLQAFNLYLQDSAEGEVFDLGKPIRYLQVRDDGAAWLATADGLYFLDAGRNIKFLGRLPETSALAMKDRRGEELWFAADGALSRLVLPEFSISELCPEPDPVQAIIPPRESWMKTTRPINQKPLGTPPFQILYPNPLSFYFLDPEGEPADVIVILEAAPPQNVSFLEGGTVKVGRALYPNGLMDISFFGGTQPGLVCFKFTVISADGQTSESEYVLQTIPPL